MLIDSKNLTDNEHEFIVELINTSLNSIKVHLSKKGIIYTQLEEKIDESGFSKFEKLLQSLHEKGFLKVIEEEYTLFCPQCDFPFIYSKYACPTCSSTHVKQIILIQHPFCGYIGKKTKTKDTDSFSCPKCNTDLPSRAEAVTDADSKIFYKVIGFSFECQNGHHFERPLITHLCPNCDAKFNYKESNYRPIYSYELTEKAQRIGESKFNIEEILGEITQSLKELEIKVTLNAEVRGLSSSMHKVHLLGEKDNHVLLVDVSTRGTSDELIALLGKKMDIKDSYTVMVDPMGKEEMSALGQVYGIKVLDPKDNDWLSQLKEYVLEEVFK